MKSKNNAVKKILARGVLFAILTLLLSPLLLLYQKYTQSYEYNLSKVTEFRENIRNDITTILNQDNIPHSLKQNGEEVKLELTINKELQAYTDRQLKNYKPDYAAIVLMDTKTGKILSLSSFAKENDFHTNLALKASYPAASIFKIITSAAAIDKYSMKPETVVPFNGGNHTLYRKNVMSDQITRWTRFATLEDAFAHSWNTFFARLTFTKMQPEDLETYSDKFYFNREIKSDFFVDKSIAAVPHAKDYHLAEIASGFNDVNTLSPIHGAMIAASIAEDGKMMLPYIVDSAQNLEDKKVYESKPITLGQTITKESSVKMQELMHATIYEGTSRKSFRPLTRNRKFSEVDLGGKTGSLDNDILNGRTDWFVGYAKKNNTSLAIAVVTVHKKYWTVKSATLAQLIFREYFEEHMPQNLANK